MLTPKVKILTPKSKPESKLMNIASTLKPKIKKEDIDFCHLHLHDTHSLLDGLGATSEYVEKAKSLGMKSIAITNHANINSLIDLQKSCDKNNIKSIFGVEHYVVPNGNIKEKGEKRGHLTTWIKNENGWSNSLKMLSKANLYYKYYRPRIDFELILENCEGLFFGSACTASILNIEGGEDFFIKLHRKTKSCFLELMPHIFEEQIIHNKKCLKMHKEHNIPIIISNDAHYVNKEDSESHDVMLCIQTQKTIDDPNRWRFTGNSFYLNSSKEMFQQFEEQNVIGEKYVLEGMKNTLYIAENCNYRIEKREINLPEVPQYKGLNEEGVLRDLCSRSFKEKFGTNLF